MHQQVKDIFDDRIVLLRAKSFYDDFYIKEGDIYILIFTIYHLLILGGVN